MLSSPADTWPLMITYIVIAVSAAFIWYSRRSKKASLPFPPGPKPIPFLGNIHKFPPLDAQWELLKYMADEAGTDVLYFWFKPLRISILSLHSYKAFHDCLVERGPNYADKPNFVMHEFMDNRTMLTDGYTAEWRARRKLVHEHLKSTTIRQFYDTIEREVVASIRRMHTNPESHIDEIDLHVVKNILDITYGIQDLKSLTDDVVSQIDLAVRHTTDVIIPGKFKIELLPWLRYLPTWFPGGGDKALALKWRAEDDVYYGNPYFEAKKKIEAGDEAVASSFVRHLLDVKAHSDPATQSQYFDDRSLMGLAGIMYGAGQGTTASTLHGFILAMTLFPEVQKKAQEEIDRVIGGGRLITMEDMPRLPYINALMLEVLRWWIVAPVASTHRNAEADDYRGWNIPAKSYVILNVWAVSRDESLYPEPEEFRPERWSTPLPDGQLPPDPHKWAFSAGRRACPGADLADALVFTYIANTLATTTISQALDDNGVPIIPSTKSALKERNRIIPYKNVIKPRDTAFTKIIDSGV